MTVITDMDAATLGDDVGVRSARTAVLDKAHLGDIHGALGTYTQAGQNYGTTLMWTLMLLIPVLYVNQEMVVRLGAVTGVGHARLIFERFGKFWGAFSVIDLFLLNGLTIVTEFIGISLALNYLGLSQFWGGACLCGHRH